MFRRLRLIVFAIILAASVRPALAQNFGFRGRDFEKIMQRGYTEEELIAEKKLLAIDKSQPITWKALPLIQYPRTLIILDSEHLRARIGEDKFRELQQSKTEAARKRFVDTKLNDRTFSGTVRIARKEQNGKEYTIYSKEPSRPVAPHPFAYLWPAYFCQWQADNDRGFKVGENVDIVGKIDDLKEDGKTNTLFLKSVVIAPQAAEVKEAPSGATTQDQSKK